MDPANFDALARNLVGRRSRRALLTAVAALDLAGVPRPTTAKKRRRNKKPCQPATSNLQAVVNGVAPGASVRLCTGVFPGLLTVDKDLTLIGAGVGRTTLSGGGGGTVLAVAGGKTAAVRGLAITDGQGGVSSGGGIDNAGTLTLFGCAVRGNGAEFGAGVRNRAGARLTLDATTVAGNTATGGGGLANEGDLIVRNGSIIGSTNPDDGNTARSGGGLSNQGAGTATFAKGTRVTGNEVNGGGGGTGFPDGGGIFNSVAGGVTLATTGIVFGNTRSGEPNNCRGVPVANCLPDA